MGGNALALQPPEIVSQFSGATGDAEATDLEIAGRMQAQDPLADNGKTPTGTEIAEAGIAPATVVPEPAPRDGAGNPLLMQGTKLAFAYDENGVAVDGDPALAHAPARPEMPRRETATQQATSDGAPPRSLFEMLRRRFRRRAAIDNSRRQQAAATKVAALDAGTTRNQAPGGGVGVGTAPAGAPAGLSDDEHDDHHGEDASFELASAAMRGRLSPNGLRLQTEQVQVGCLKPGLIAILKTVERHYRRKPIVTSGYRSPNRNRRAGGARKSLHMQCMAADIQVEGVSKWDLAAFLRTVPGRGGVGTYCRTRSVHIDIGEERSWYYPCRRRTRLKS